MATAEELMQFQNYLNSGDYSAAANLAASRGYTPEQTAQFVSQTNPQFGPVTQETVRQYTDPNWLSQLDWQSGVNDPVVQQVLGDASWQTLGNKAEGFTPEFWQQEENAVWLDDAVRALERAGATPDQVSKIAQYYGVDPTALGAASASQYNVGNDWAGKTADQWIKDLTPSAYFNESNSIYDWSRPYLSSPYEAVAGQGDLYAGLSARGFDDAFVRNILQNSPDVLQDADLGALTSPFFDINDPLQVLGVNQDPMAIRNALIAQLGPRSEAELQEAARYLYGIDLPSATPPAPVVDEPDNTPSTWTGEERSPIRAFNVDLSSPFAGSNWRGTLEAQIGMSGDELYRFIMDKASSGDFTLSTLQRELNLNPGEAHALYESALKYAQENGLPLPRFPAATRADAPYYNYGFRPAQRLFSREIDGQSVVNPIAAYLRQISGQAPVEAAEGGYMKGGLTRIHNDPVVKRYMKGGGGGQADDIPARLSSGEYVMDADVVAALGDGNPDAGAAKLDRMRENIRKHKRSAPASKIPPKSKKPEQYLKG